MKYQTPTPLGTPLPHLLGPLINLAQKHLKHLLLHPTPRLINLPNQPHHLVIALLFIDLEFGGNVNVGAGEDGFDDLFRGGVLLAIVLLCKGRRGEMLALLVVRMRGVSLSLG